MRVQIINGFGGNHLKLAQDIAGLIDGTVVHNTKHKYGPEWSHKSMEEYHQDLFSDIASHSCPVVTTGSTFDNVEEGADRMTTQKRLAEEATVIIILTTPSLLEMTAQVIDRFIDRATGEQSSPFPETSMSRASSLLKQIDQYPYTSESLAEMKTFIRDNYPDKTILSGTCEEVYQQFQAMLN